MKKIWFDKAWDDYMYWQSQDKKILKRINQLIRDTERNPFEGIGKVKVLKTNHNQLIYKTLSNYV